MVTYGKEWWREKSFKKNILILKKSKGGHPYRIPYNTHKLFKPLLDIFFFFLHNILRIYKVSFISSS